MNIENLIRATATVLLCLPASALAGMGDPDPNPPVAASAYASSDKPSMARGTDLRPCKPGTYSEFSRLTGGYHCVRNP